MQEITILRKKDTYFISLLSGGIGAAFSGYTVYNALQNPKPFGLGSYVSLFFLVLCMVIVIDAVRKSFINTPALILNDEGLTDFISFAGLGLIGWNNISSAEIKDYKGARHILVYLKDVAPYLNEKGNVRQRIAYKMFNDVGTPLLINVKLIKYLPADLLKEIEQRKK